MGNGGGGGGGVLFLEIPASIHTKHCIPVQCIQSTGRKVFLLLVHFDKIRSLE
jgi:hypothetical protein